VGLVAAFLSVHVGVFATAAAILGAVLSLKETHGTWRIVLIVTFLLLGIGELLVIFNVDKAHDNEVNVLKGQLNVIQKQTEFTHHTHLDILEPIAVTNDPYLPFKQGKTPNLAIAFVNVGDDPATDSALAGGVDVLPRPLSDEGEREAWSNSALHKNATIAATVNAHSQVRYNTIAAAEPLTKQQALGLNNGSLSLCVTARVLWKDTTGVYCNHSFRCLHRQPSPKGTMVFNWETQGLEHNNEKKCEYNFRQRVHGQ
jgi:hypothetical protein